MATPTSPAPSLQTGAELEQPLNRLQACMKALQFSPRARPGSSRVALWQHDPRETWLQLVDPDGQDPTSEGK